MDVRPCECVSDPASDWWTARRFSLVLALLITAAFPDILIGAKTFVFRDYMLFGYSVAHYHRQSFWSGEIPLWNPLSQCGLPFLAQWNTMVLYPLSFIYLLLPMPWSLSFFCLVHLFLGGLGMYLLARRWTNNGWASAVAGTAYAFSGVTLSCLMYSNNSAGLGWLPWVLLLVERGWREGGRITVLAALVAAAQMLAGAPEVFLLTWLILLALWLAQFVIGSTHRAWMVGRASLIVGLVVGLTAAQMLPLLELFGQSQRQQALYESNRWPLAGTGWANFLVPLFRCIRTPLGAFMQAHQGWISSTYLGVGILLIAWTALWVVRHRAVWLFGVLVGISLILALGDGALLYPWLRKVFPPIMGVRYPVKFVIVAACLMPLLAAFGIAHFLNSTDESRRRFRMITAGLALLFCALIAGTIWFAFRYPGIQENWKWTLTSGTSRAVLLWLIVGLLFLMPLIVRSRLRIGAQFILLLLLFLDAVTHSPQQNPRVSPEAYTLALPPLLEMNPQIGNGTSRVALSYGAMWDLHTTFASNPFDAALVSRMGLHANANLIDAIPKADGFFALSLRDEQNLRLRAFRRGKPVPNGLADFMAIRYLCPPGGSFDWTNRPTAMLMATAGQKPEFAAPEQIVDALLEPEFDPCRTVYLPLSAQGKLSVSNFVETSVAVKTAMAHHWAVEVSAPAPTLLVVAQAFYPRWKARVDGNLVPIWKANFAFQAIEVPAGRHDVTLQYEDLPFRAGTLITGTTLGICLVLLWYFRSTSRTPLVPANLVAAEGSMIPVDSDHKALAATPSDTGDNPAQNSS
jgi:hypothetical protein